MARAQILLEGSYHYFSGEDQYCQENFKFIQNIETQSYQIHSEILTRIESGEFLKVLVTYEMNQSFLPVMSRIERSLGKHYSHELYKLDVTSHELHYTFQTPSHTQEYKTSFNIKHYLTSPAFATSCLFLQTKKIDTVSRTPVTLLSSQNSWTYEKPPHEKVVFAEYKTHEAGQVNIGGKDLIATQISFYEQDASGPLTDEPANFFISKYFSVPYQMIQGDQKIVINHLKKNF